MSTIAISDLWFLERNVIYDTEKVYELKYDPPQGLPKSNMKLEKKPAISIQDIRGNERNYSFERNGFTIMNIGNNMAIDEYEDEGKLKENYFPKLAFAVRDLLKADRVQIFDYVVGRVEWKS